MVKTNRVPEFMSDYMNKMGIKTFWIAVILNK